MTILGGTVKEIKVTSAKQVARRELAKEIFLQRFLDWISLYLRPLAHWKDTLIMAGQVLGATFLW